MTAPRRGLILLPLKSLAEFPVASMGQDWHQKSFHIHIYSKADKGCGWRLCTLFMWQSQSRGGWRLVGFITNLKHKTVWTFGKAGPWRNELSWVECQVSMGRILSKPGLICSSWVDSLSVLVSTQNQAILNGLGWVPSWLLRFVWTQKLKAKFRWFQSCEQQKPAKRCQRASKLNPLVAVQC